MKDNIRKCRKEVENCAVQVRKFWGVTNFLECCVGIIWGNVNVKLSLLYGDTSRV